MSSSLRTPLLFAAMAGLIVMSGLLFSWNFALKILCMGLISAVMALGVNLQWGIAGLFNVGIMGFTALGGLAVVLTSMPPIPAAWSAGGLRIGAGLLFGTAVVLGAVYTWQKTQRGLLVAAILLGGFSLYKMLIGPAIKAVEAVDPALNGYLGGLGLPVLLAWPVGGLLAAAAAWVIGKTALGLRSDYLAIATLGISEIVISLIKNEEWLARGVKNVTSLPRPVPYEIDLQKDPGFIERAASLGLDPTTASTLWVKLSYAALFASVLVIMLVLTQLALKSPWGRMMRAIRDNEDAARAMGKNVTARHLQVFVLGSAICGVAGAMLTTFDGLLTPGSYQPLRHTFLIWVMVIIGGSGNNLGAVLGGFVIWFLWDTVEPLAQWLMPILTSGLADGPLKDHLLTNAAHLKLLTMGILLLLVLRFSPRGLIPEK